MSSTAVMEKTSATQAQPPALVVLRDRLVARRAEIAHALEGSGISPDRFIRTALTAATIQPELVSDVTFQSLWVAILKACRDRLVPDQRQGVIIPYKRQAVWVPMYRGLLDRFEQSGEYKWITAGLHREDDRAWDVWIDETGQHFLHRPGPGAGKVIESYAAALTRSGGFFVSVVSETDMARIRQSSRAKSEDAPWAQWPDQMRMKSALRRLCKLLPMPQPLDELMREGEDEAPVPLLGHPPPAAPRVRARGAQNALEQFAPAEPEPPPEPEPPEAAAEPEPPEHGTQPEEPQKPPEEIAYERGRQAKADGLQRKAVPPEYRVPERDREAISWRQGWDGEMFTTPMAAGADHGGS